MTTPTDIEFVDQTTVITEAWLDGINDWVNGTAGVLGTTYTASAFRTALGAETTRAALTNYDVAEASVASATTTDIGAAASSNILITGTTTITGFGTVTSGTTRKCRFADALTLTHNSTSLIIPYGINITTAAGDSFEAESLGSGNWKVLWYQRANGAITTSGLTQAANKMLGRSTAGTGAVEEITVGTGLTLSGGTLISSPVQIQSISASVAGNALTISASTLSLDFRSTTLGSGTVTTVSGTPTNIVISSGSTLGTVSAVQSRIVVLALNNAGTIELAAVNISGGNDLSETGVISTTAEGGAGGADSANVIYSTTARTNVAYRVIGYIESTQSTAGTWATVPSTIQGYGGQALATMSGLGYGQTWQSLTGSRAIGTTYYNTTGRPIQVSALIASSVTGFSATVSVTRGGVTSGAVQTNESLSSAYYQNGKFLDFVVPPGSSYSVNNVSQTSSVISWDELR